jgi:hypothetical protein
MRKEMKNVIIEFKIINGEESAPPTYQDICCHIIFYAKMEDFCSKARFVAGGHTAYTPHVMTYASVFSRESVIIALTLAALNDLDVKMADTENAYLPAPITERVWTALGTEFGDDAGKRALIVRALYGLKSSGAAFRNHLGECMKHLGWHPCRADRDLLMKAETRPDDGVLYWAYIFIYVDDILCVHHDPVSPLAKLDEYFKMKEGSIQVPTFYLGAKLNNNVLPNGVVAWGMSSRKYVQSAVHHVKEYLAALPGDQKLMKKSSGPFTGGYKPELDESPELDPTRANFYQSQIRILRWYVELGRIGIINEVSMLSTYLCLPLEGHLEAFFHVFAYLGLHHNARVVFDPTYPTVDMGTLIKTDFKYMYGYVKEMIPSDAPVPRGKEVDLRLFVDSDHWVCHILEHGANCVVLQASANYGVKCFWSGVC